MSNKEESDSTVEIRQLQHVDEAEISNFRVFLITVFVAFGGFLFGYDCVIGGELTDVAKFVADFGSPQPPDGEYGFPHALRGAIVSILSVGTFFGSLCASQFADRIGRKKGLMVTCIIFTIGIAIQTWAPSVAVLMVGRCVGGYGVGLVSVMIPLYQSECVPGKRRGTVVSCYQLAITIGLLIGQITVYFTKDRTTSAAYRIPIALQFLWSTVLFVSMFFFPESPRYLIKRGKWEDAVRSKCRLSGLPPTHPHVQNELLEIKGNLEHELAQGPATYAQCWQGNNFRRTMLGIFMQAWQQLTGVNFIFYYGAMFFASAGIENPFLVGMIMGTVNTLSTFLGMYLIDKIGRRRLLLCGAVIQSTSHFLVAIIALATHNKVPICTIVFCAIFICSFAASWGPSAWVITSELFGLKTRAKQMSFAVAGNWAFNVLLGQVSPMIAGDMKKPVLGTNVAFVWGALNFGCFLYVYFFIPEMKGLQLEQVDELFEKKISPKRTVGWKPTVSYKGRAQELKTLDSEDSKERPVVIQNELV